MGNCLVLHPKTIQIVKPDGKVLEYRNLVKVHEVLADFSGHGMLETPPPVISAASRYLSPEMSLKRSRSYYLVPLPSPPEIVRRKGKKKKKVRFADSPDSDRDAGDTGAVPSGSPATASSADGEMMGEGRVSAGEDSV
ncbi:hypothetical protein SAY87_008057 [Trapa incisa]|uniref:Uncharacterized protein n=1 Tax=Trapa incisa TaxID=236973 RepID=A0AAN7QIY2_9MYRT|nr:hypothetical protein SAY87_008057 [Trapa incisa]